MRQRWKIRLTAWILETGGSITVEAALILPVIFLLTTGFLFMGIYFYQKATAYERASALTANAAFLWDNSYRDGHSGSYVYGKYDGLYWRFREDNFMNVLRNELPERKMNRLIHALPAGWNISMNYSNTLLERKVSAETGAAIQKPWFSSFMQRDRVNGRSEASVVDPMEFIRLVRLIEHYLPQLGQDESAYSAPPILEEEWEHPGKTPPKVLLEFTREPEARAFMQKETGGKQTTIRLADGRRRQIDALDPDGIAHQAYIGYVSNRFTQLENGDKVNEQIEKDVLLMREGKVKAVVWHFYRKKGETRNGPTGPLRKELERQGIIIVIHDQEYREAESS